MGLIEQAKAAYVAGRIAIDEFERLIEDALDQPESERAFCVERLGINEFPPPAWMVADFQRTYAAASRSRAPMVLPAGATFTATQRGRFLNDGTPSGVIVL